MILASITKDGVTIIDGDIAKKWDNFGNEVSTVDVKDISSAEPYKAISVLTSMGESEIAVYDNQHHVFKGDSSSVITINSKGMFLRRLRSKGRHEGVSYTQTIFLYGSLCDLGSVVMACSRP